MQRITSELVHASIGDVDLTPTVVEVVVNEAPFREAMTDLAGAVTRLIETYEILPAPTRRVIATAAADRAYVDDSHPIDDTPDDCWRCDATTAATDVGLCADCLVALR